MEEPNISKMTLLSHIYNEEYLLPFWLQHHKDMFDDIIIIDYHSTDRSVEICKTLCPNCTIITTRNACFDAREVDKEIMDIEETIEGIKIVLNTTEFLFCNKPIKELFEENFMYSISYSINCVSPYSTNYYDIKNYKEFISHLLDDDIRYHSDRFTRQIHNYKNGKYDIGRHKTFNITISTEEAYVVWFGFYPMNELQLQRKLQIQNKMSQRDKNDGLGNQHLFSKEKMLEINGEKTNTGKKLKDINPILYNLLYEKCKGTK